MDIGTVSFCGSCGANQQEQTQASHNQAFTPQPQVQQVVVQQQPKQTNGAAVCGLVFSILGILCILPVLGSFVGFICSIVGLRKAKRLNGEGRGMALGGLIVGIVGLLFWIAIAAIIAVFVIFFQEIWNAYIELILELVYGEYDL